MKYAPRTAFWVYPWDVVEEGADRIVSLLADDLGIGGVRVAAAYHRSWVLSSTAPSSPVRTLHDTRAFFHPDWSRYESCGVAPTVSENLGRSDPLADLRRSCGQARIQFTVWSCLSLDTELAMRRPDTPP